MSNRNIFLKIIFILFMIIAVDRIYAFDNDDFQVWYTQNEEFKVSKIFKIALEEELRWADNANRFYYHHHDLGFLFNLKENNFGFGYRHIYEEKKAKFKIENEPYVVYGCKWKIKFLDFNHRLRLEYRHFEYQSDSWRLRNKIDIVLSLKYFEIHPYLSEEIFLNFQNRSFSQNRLFLGLSKDLTKNLKIDIYYLVQHNNSLGKWMKINVLGTKIKFIF